MKKRFLTIFILLIFSLIPNCIGSKLNHPFDGAPGLLTNQFFTQLATLAIQTPTATATVSGKLVDSSGTAIANATLTVANSASVRETGSVGKTVSTSTTTDSGGNWTLNLRVAVFTISVTSSTGASLGTMTITVTSTTSATAVPAAGASFTVTGVTTAPFTTQTVIPKPSITVRVGTIEYKNGDTITITGSKSNTNIPAELTIINNSSASLNLTGGTQKAVIGGINARDFKVTNPSLDTLIPGATSSFTINFNTNTLGDKLAEVSIPNDDLTNSNFKLNLKGVFEPSGTIVFAATNMITKRSLHAATLLSNGKVLITGGNVSGIASDWTTTSQPQASAEIFDPATETFTAIGSMNFARRQHTSTLLNNGKVLIAGGHGQQNAELYDPSTGTFLPTGNMISPRNLHTATLLNNGKVLVAGGSTIGDVGPGFGTVAVKVALQTAEIYDPATGTFSSTGDLIYYRESATASLLNSGDVLITGGLALNNGLGTAEIFRISSGTFIATGNLISDRYRHTANTLSNGKVLINGGYLSSLNSNLISAELFDPSTGTFTQTGNANVPRSFFTATFIGNEKILMVGGNSNSNTSYNSTEMYDVPSGTFTMSGSLSANRQGHTATLLNNGKVLIVGGSDSSGPLSTAEIYYP